MPFGWCCWELTGPPADCGRCVQEHQQLEQEAKELAEKIHSIVGRAQHLASNHFNSQKILQETDAYLSL